ncbi:hypothetical protein DSO57_1005715 [Entomophthora muscae]|uniref:Uncharacterized protein n=1 Tax=Entomophthora muscae TaxID=34485 RepID=A0ACC2SKL4_9FUNG|nr:hypothetical protein DSO57_1005715 [Entomophthora muscae]
MGLIGSVLPAAGPWAVAGKALSYLVKLGPIIWWAMPVPALTPPSPAGAPQYSWYPDRRHVFPEANKTNLFCYNLLTFSAVYISVYYIIIYIAEILEDSILIPRSSDGS